MADDKTNVVDMAAERAKRDPNAARYSLSVAFVRDSHDFIYGVQIGILMIRLESRPETWRGTYYTANKPDIERVSAAAGYEVIFTDSGVDEWVFADFRQLA